jgi:hypothetical protein
MRGLLLRLFCIVGALMAIWYGVDRWVINPEPKVFTIEEVEKNGVGDARYIVVTGGATTGNRIEVSTNKTVIGAILPVFSQARLATGRNNPQLPTSVLYSLEGTRGCLMDNSCDKPGPIEVKGVVEGNDFFSTSRSHSSSYPRAPNFIFVNEGEPPPRFISLLIFFGAGVLLMLGLLPTRLFNKYVRAVR